jgi:hypothetical protein
MQLSWTAVLLWLLVIALALNLVAAVMGSSSYALAPKDGGPKTGVVLDAKPVEGDTCNNLCDAEKSTCVQATAGAGISFDNTMGSAGVTLLANCDTKVQAVATMCLCE